MPERLRVGLALLFPVAALTAAALLAIAKWPSYWRWIAPEQTPMTFVQSLLLFSGAIFAALLAIVATIEARPRAERVVWSLTALGFLYLTADERFALHERLRDNVLADLGVALPWGSPGDYVLVVFLAGSLLVLPRLVRLLRRNPPALPFFGAGILLTVVAIAADTVDPTAMSVDVERVEQTLEEVVEALAASLLAAGLFLTLTARLAVLGTPGASPAADAPEALRGSAPETDAKSKVAIRSY